MLHQSTTRTHRKPLVSIPRRLGTLALALALAACPAPDSGENTVSAGTPSTPDAARPDIQALNAFYYYEDVEAAWDFYTNVLGFETVVDYGFAKILQVAPASYLTLVDAARGMHSASEPKSVTLAIVTRQVQGWYDYLVDQGVDMRSDLNMREGSAHDGFVAIDPEGYLLEFEWFNDHEENERLSPRLDRIEPIQGGRGSRPSELGVHATVLWLYYDDLGPIQEFYEALLAVDLLVDQGWAKVYSASPTGFIGLVDASRGLHQATSDKAVTISFFTEDVDGWLDRVQTLGVELRTGEIGMESDRVRTLVGYDPDGYFLEWDTFLERDGNERLLELMR